MVSLIVLGGMMLKASEPADIELELGPSAIGTYSGPEGVWVRIQDTYREDESIDLRLILMNRAQSKYMYYATPYVVDNLVLFRVWQFTVIVRDRDGDEYRYNFDHRTATEKPILSVMGDSQEYLRSDLISVYFLRSSVLERAHDDAEREMLRSGEWEFRIEIPLWFPDDLGMKRGPATELMTDWIDNRS